MAVTIGPHSLTRAQLVPAKYQGKLRQSVELAHDGSVLASGSTVKDRIYTVRCKLPRAEAEKIANYIENSLRGSAELVSVTDGFGVTRQMRYWDDAIEYSVGGGGFTEIVLVFREERVE